MTELTVDAVIDNVHAVTGFVNEQLETLCCPIKTQIQIDIAIDELFSNIAYYAYAPGSGKATVRLEAEENPAAVIITFIDSGKPFNPLESEEPDTTLPLKERKIGGLGIFLVKKTMDMMDYRYEDGQNILTVKKKLQQ